MAHLGPIYLLARSSSIFYGLLQLLVHHGLFDALGGHILRIDGLLAAIAEDWHQVTLRGVGLVDGAIVKAQVGGVWFVFAGEGQQRSSRPKVTQIDPLYSPGKCLGQWSADFGDLELGDIILVRGEPMPLAEGRLRLVGVTTLGSNVVGGSRVGNGHVPAVVTEMTQMAVQLVVLTAELDGDLSMESEWPRVG